MSHGPSTLGTMITWSLSPISVTSCVRSSRTHGLSRLLTRVQSWVSPKSTSLPTRINPARAASLRSAGIASSRLPSRMSACLAMSGTFAAIFSFEASKKWIIREGGKGISVAGAGAPMASGLRKSRGLLIGAGRLQGVELAPGVVLVEERLDSHDRSVPERVDPAALHLDLDPIPATEAVVRQGQHMRPPLRDLEQLCALLLPCREPVVPAFDHRLTAGSPVPAAVRLPHRRDELDVGIKKREQL